MNWLLVAGTLSLFVMFLSLVVQTSLLERDRKQMRKLELKPNCLLTRYPLVFISGRKSLFYFLNYWNRIPKYLAEHGYEVLVLDLPWSDRARRIAALKAALVGRERSCHLIGDSSVDDELKIALSWQFPQVISVTVVEEERVELASKLKLSDLQPRRDGIQTLRLPQSPITLSPLNLLARVLLRLHNLVTPTDPRVRASEIGLVDTKSSWSIEQGFLDFAISLAERDAQ